MKGLSVDQVKFECTPAITKLRRELSFSPGGFVRLRSAALVPALAPVLGPARAEPAETRVRTGARSASSAPVTCPWRARRAPVKVSATRHPTSTFLCFPSHDHTSALTRALIDNWERKGWFTRTTLAQAQA